MQAFAPTPYLYEPTASNGINLDEEIKLSTNARDRDCMDTLAVVYSILISLDFLEKAYVRDSIPIESYQRECSRLLNQYQHATSSLAAAWPGLSPFSEKYRVNTPLAAARIKEGSPAGEAILVLPQVAEPPTAPAVPKGTSAARVAETVQNFITLMDALKLSFRAKDQLHPLLSDLMTSLTEQDEESDQAMPELAGRANIVKWLIRINQMKVSEEINDEEARELFFEVEGLYGEYLKTL